MPIIDVFSDPGLFVIDMLYDDSWIVSTTVRTRSRRVSYKLAVGLEDPLAKVRLSELNIWEFAPLAQLDRASVYGTEGCPFESGGV